MFERLGVKHLAPWTRPMSFMGVSVSSFKPAKKDNLSNRSQSDWKKAEYVVVEKCDKEDEAIILEVWKQITSRDPDAPYKIQKILIKTSNDQYDLYDYDANKIASGSLKEIETFIRTSNAQQPQQLESATFTPIPKLSLEELGVALAEEYANAISSANGDALGTVYSSIFKYGDSIFDLNGKSLYSASALANAAVAASKGYKESYGAEISKAFKLQSIIRRSPEEYNFLRRLLGMSSQSKSETPAIPMDRLTVALKVFEEKRQTAEWCTGDVSTRKYEFVNSSVREYFDSIRGQNINDMSDEEIQDFCINHTWSLTNGRAWPHILSHTQEERTAFKSFIESLKVRTDFITLFEGKTPKGIKNSSITELLMKFQPEKFCLYNTTSSDVVQFLGLTSATFDSKFSSAEYIHYLSLCTQIRDRMREFGIARTLDEADNAPADYLTVNEFLWFVNDNKDLIEEEVVKMSKKIEKAKKDPNPGTRKLKDAVENDALMQRLMAALRTKPFAILAGHSGTGKSRLVRRLAYMTCNDKGLLAEAAKQNAPGNYLMVQVKPNWHDSSDLLGYYSELKGQYKTTAFVDFICKAYAYPETPFFVCLDEMNLAPVEHYFAEYLSAIESVKEKDDVYSCDPLIADKKIDFRQLLLGDGYTESQEIYEKHGLIIPKNLFVVGTVNVDETTHQFSRKVLGRAMTLLMNDVDFSSMTAMPTDPSEEELLDQKGIEFFLGRKFKAPLKDDEPARLNKLNDALKNTAFIVAYRFANEMALYREAIAKLNDKADALDHVVLMKLLPRIHGEANSVRELFGKLKPLFEGGALSVTEMDKIVERKDSYLSFWP